MSNVGKTSIIRFALASGYVKLSEMKQIAHESHYLQSHGVLAVPALVAKWKLVSCNMSISTIYPCVCGCAILSLSRDFEPIACAFGNRCAWAKSFQQERHWETGKIICLPNQSQIPFWHVETHTSKMETTSTHQPLLLVGVSGFRPLFEHCSWVLGWFESTTRVQTEFRLNICQPFLNLS